jgi:hypothetical protein
MIPLLFFSTMTLKSSLQVAHLNVVYKKTKGIYVPTSANFERLSYRGGSWDLQSVPVSGFEHVIFPGGEVFEANSRKAAFCSSKGGKNGVTVVSLNGHCQFVPIEEKVYGLEFLSDEESLLVQTRRGSGASLSVSMLIRFTKAGALSIQKIPAWIASPCEAGLAGVDEKDVVRIWGNAGTLSNPPLVNRLQLLLKERISDRVQPFGVFGARGSRLPTNGPSYTKEYLVSKTLKSMFEMRLNNPGLPIRERERLDGMNDFSEDGIFQPGRGVIWRVTRPDAWGYSGKSLTDSHLRFMSVVPLKMGKKHLRSYEPGIYDVDFVNSKVTKLAPLPPELAKTKDHRVWTLVN